MPICSVAPSGIRAATCSPMADSASRRLGRLVRRGAGGRCGSKAVSASTCTSVLPCVRGICSLISAIENPGAAGGGNGDVDRRAQRAVAVLVGRRELQQRRVERDPPAGEQGRDVGEEHRREVAAPLVDGIAKIRADEEGVRPEAGGRGLVDCERARQVEVVGGDVLDVAPFESVDERRRRGGRAVEKNVHSAVHVGDRFVGADGATDPLIRRICPLIRHCGLKA